MKTLKGLLKLTCLFLFLSFNNLNAATITATSNGYWYNNIWSNATGPQPGDEIIIPDGVEVFLNTLIDLSTTGGNTPTTIIVDGKLTFLDAAIFCLSGCEVGLWLDFDSELHINNEEGIDESVLSGGAAQIIYFGNTVVDLTFPFGPGTITSAGALLPVELVSFEGVAAARANELRWATATEENTSHFIIERSANGIDGYESIGRVVAAGFTNSIQNYSYSDDADKTMSYYRLRIVDFDGNEMFSNLVALERSKDVFEVEVFPNPVIEDVNVSLNMDKAGPVEITVFDHVGKLVQKDIYDLNAGQNTVVFNIEGPKYLVYFVNVSYDDHSVSKKIMATK